MPITSKTEQDFLRLLQELLPSGQAWTRDPDAKLTKLLEATAIELATFDSRMMDFLTETDPRSTLELLPEWEAMAGLPDGCLGLSDNFQQRRNDVFAKLFSEGGGSREYFVFLAERLGYDIRIIEWDAFIVGLAASGDFLLSNDFRYHWTVQAPAKTILYFHVGTSGCGDFLAEWDNAVLECYLLRQKPAHTTLDFQYSEFSEEFDFAEFF